MRAPAARSWARLRRRAAPAAVMRPGEGPAAAASYHFFWRNARTVARARVLLALGNALVIYLDPSEPPSREWRALAAAYGTVALLILYSLWVWGQYRKRSPPEYLPALANWLDVLFSAALVGSTGAYKSPFYMWFVFTVVGSALKGGLRAAISVCLAQLVLYVALCLPHLDQPDFVVGTFLVRTSYLFVIALVLAHMGQQLLEQNQTLAGLHAAARHMSTGGSISDILGRTADSLADLLQTEQVAVAGGEESSQGMPPALVNIERAQAERLVRLARDCVAAAPATSLPVTCVSNDPGRDTRFAAAGDALAGVRTLLATRVPGRDGDFGVLVACNRRGGRGFTLSDQELAELVAAHVGPLLETARLQEQRRYHAGRDERRRIAAELHDGLIQTLAGMDLRILHCSDLHRSRHWDALAEELLLLKLIAGEALGEARAAVNELAPVRLREEGLAVFLEDGIQRFRDGTGIPVEACIELGEIDVPEPTALLVIGLLREGLNNIRKHAHAGCVALTVALREDAVIVRLADDGAGFTPEESAALREPTRHYGLAYLRERVAAVGGELQISSRPGSGTALEARVPLLTEERLVALLSRLEGLHRDHPDAGSSGT